MDPCPFFLHFSLSDADIGEGVTGFLISRCRNHLRWLSSHPHLQRMARGETKYRIFVILFFFSVLLVSLNGLLFYLFSCHLYIKQEKKPERAWKSFGLFCNKGGGSPLRVQPYLLPYSSSSSSFFTSSLSSPTQSRTEHWLRS